jgi:hypothetical protein
MGFNSEFKVLMLIVSAQLQIGSGSTAAYGSMAVNIKRKPCGL